jgi:hypothetical protein
MVVDNDTAAVWVAVDALASLALREMNYPAASCGVSKPQNRKTLE